MDTTFIQACECLADLYDVRFVHANQAACDGNLSDPWNALEFFLLEYAFERQGASPDYPAAAIDTVRELRCRCDRWAIDPHNVWEAIEAKLHGVVGLNHRTNPMCPRHTEYEWEYRKQPRKSKVRGCSILELLQSFPPGKSVTSWADDCIRAGAVGEAHGKLCDVNGINDKIAAYFLRDVASIGRIHLKSANRHDRRCLQPVDKWIREVARHLTGGNELEDTRCKDFFIDHSDDAERANQGVWYFCTQVAGSSTYRVRRSIEEPRFRECGIQTHLADLVNSAEVARRSAERWAETSRDV